MRTEDGHIIFQCLNGNPAAFGLLVDKYKASIYALAYSKLRHFEDAEDVTQEVFIKAYRKLHTLRMWDNFLAWLYAITSNLCKQWIRSQSKRPDREFIADHDQNVLDHLSMDFYSNESVYKSIHEALDALPENFCQVLMLHYFGGLKSTEIARLLGTSTSTITKRLAIGRTKLREEMLTMMNEAYEQNKLGPNFTFRIMAILRDVKTQHLPRTQWLPWGISILSGVIITLLSFSSPQVLLHAIIPGSMLAEKGSVELSSSFLGTDSSIYDHIKALPYIDVPVGLKSNSEGRNQTGLKDHNNSGIGDQKDNRSSQMGQGLVASAGQKNNMPIADTITVSGQVLKDDAPVSNAHVYVCDVINGIIQQGETETDGSFQLEIPVPEYKNWGQFNLTVVAKHPQYSYGWTGITKDNSDDLIIWLKQPKSIAGKITDESGTPIKLAKAQIRVIYIPQSGKTSMNGDYIPGCASLTDSDGNFILNGLPDGSRAYLVITGSGYARQDTDKDTDAGANGLVFRLKKGGRIEGQVIFSETGKPASGIRVYAQMPRASAESLTDENGNYVLDNLPEGAYTVTANQYHILFKDKQPDWVAVPKNFVKAMAGETAKDINIELTEGVIVSGKVTDRDTNMPIPDQQVYLEMESQSLRYEANTDINGTYKIRAIPGKAKVLLLAKEGYLVNLPLSPIANFENREVEIMEGKEISGVDFKLNKGFIFTGTVLSPEGKPVEGAEIIDRMDPFRICGRSDKDGRFTASGIKDKKPGEKLIIEARQSTLNLRSYMELEPKPGLDVNIIMERYEMTTISGRVVDGQGNPVNSADITLDKLENAKHPGSLSSSSYHEDPADSSGNYKINHVIVGDEYRVIARANGYQGSQTDQFTATANMQLKDIMLSDMGYFLEGTVKDTDGNPVVSAMVICGRGFSQTDVNGNYRIEGLENAVETGVGIKHPSYGNNTFYFIPTNQKQDFILEKPNGFLEGKVLDADGNPVANAGVSVQSRKHIWGYEPSGHVNNDAQTDSQGKFRLRDLIVNKTEDVYVYVRGIPGKMFENVEMNRDDVVFVLKQEPEPKKELTPQERQMADYAKTTWPRFTELVGKPAPSLDVAEWINGQPVKLSDLKGKLVILNFWKSWGTLQIEPLRLFNSLQKEYGKKGLVCITIHEFTTQTDELKKFVANAGVSYSIAVDKKSSIAVADGMTFDKYGVFQAPRAIIINKDGTVRGKVEPFEIEKTIQELLLK